jgi:hypothetical protein
LDHELPDQPRHASFRSSVDVCRPARIADNIFITNEFTGTIGEYTTSGATVNASLISGLSDPNFIAIASTVPEPGTGTFVLLGAVVFALRATQRPHVVEECDENATPKGGRKLARLAESGRG